MRFLNIMPCLLIFTVFASQANALTKPGKEVKVTYTECVRAIEKGKQITMDECLIMIF